MSIFGFGTSSIYTTVFWHRADAQELFFSLYFWNYAISSWNDKVRIHVSGDSEKNTCLCGSAGIKALIHLTFLVQLFILSVSPNNSNFVLWLNVPLPNSASTVQILLFFVGHSDPYVDLKSHNNIILSTLNLNILFLVFFQKVSY